MTAKNIFGELQNKNLSFTDVKINRSAGEVIKANASKFAVPWVTAGGSIGVFDIQKPGKIWAPHLIQAHRTPVSCLEWNPFNDSVLASASRDPEIKLWLVGDLPLAQDIKEATLTLTGHTKRVTSLTFHAAANNILLSAGGDNSAKIWDISKGECAVDMTAHPDAVNSACFGSSSQVLTSCKDGKFRLFDTRNPSTPTAAQITHENVAKGFSCVWLGPSSTMFATIGFSKGSERQVAIWDSKKCDSPAMVQTIDVSSSLLSPFYDSDLAILYLVEKGTRTFMYDIVKGDPWISALGRYESKSTQTGAALLPKRICNVMNCEVARFLYANSSDSVDIVSFFVPRKDRTIFQEDLFPPSASGEPSISAADFLSGKEATPKTKMLRPENVKSVYEIPEEEGGRSRARDQMKYVSPTLSRDHAASQPKELSEGPLMLANEGFLWTSWQQAHASIQGRTFYVFENKDAAVPLLSVPLDVETESPIASAVENQPTLIELSLFQNGNKTGSRKLRAPTPEDCGSWILSILHARERALLKPSATVVASPTMSSPSAPQGDAAANSLSGYLLKFTEGYFWNSWQKFFFEANGETLTIAASDSSSEKIESMLLEKVTSIYEASNIENAPFCFKIATATKIWTLRAPDQEALDLWITTLESIMRGIKQAKIDHSSEEALEDDTDNSAATVVEGYLSVKTGIWSLWTLQWVTGVRGEILTFKNSTSSEPTRRLPLTQVKTVDISDRDVELAFMIRMIDGTTHHFMAQSRQERDEWLAALQEMQNSMRGSIDMLDALKIDLNTLSTMSAKAIEDGLHNVVDPNRVKSGAHPLLLRINPGKRFLRATCVALAAASLASDAILILDIGTQLIQWNGTKASRMQKAKAMDVTTRIKQKERGGSCVLHVIEQGGPEEDATKSNPAKLFWQHLNGGKALSSVPASVAVEVEKEEVVKLYRVSSSKVSLIHQGRPPSRDRLNSRLVYIVESGSMVMVWNGKSSTKEAKKLGSYVAGILQSRLCPNPNDFGIILRLIENGETTLWKECFCDYPGELPISMQRQNLVSNISGRKEQRPIDIHKMHTEVRPAPVRNFSTIGGKLQMFRVDDFAKTPVIPELVGHFWSDHSFLIRYIYKEGNSDRVILYFWQGRSASVNEKGASAYLTKEMGQELKELESKQVRVPQGFEPHDFLSIFGKNFVVHSGSYKENWKSSPAMFSVRGDSELDAYPHEVALTSASLHSHHAFIVYSSQQAFIWLGSQSNEFEKARAQFLVPSATVVQEGEEPDQFWQALGGRNSFKPVTSQRYTPKLYCFSGASGVVEVYQEFDVCQDGLNTRCVCLLDIGPHACFVWFGAAAGVPEKKIALQAAIDYVKQSQKGHSMETTQLFVTKSGAEPSEFTLAFRGWSAKGSSSLWVHPLSEVFKEYQRDIYSYSELVSDELPPHVDRTKLEVYLSEEEFQTVFQMSKAEYDTVPHWKQQNLKKAVGLY